MGSLKDIRKGLRLTQAEMALSLGIEQPTYNVYENNKKVFPVHLIEKLKEIYKIDYVSENAASNNNSTTTPLNQSGVNPSAVREMELLKKELEFKTRENELLMMLLAEKEKNERLAPAIDESLERRLRDIESNIRLLFKSEEEYKKAMAYIDKPLSKVSVCVSDAAGKIVSVNDEFTKQTGYTLNEVIGKKPGSVLQGQNTDQEAVKKIREALSARKYFEGEIINYDKFGKEIKCKLTITPVKDKSGKLEKFISLAVFSKVNVLKYN